MLEVKDKGDLFHAKTQRKIQRRKDLWS